ncbi:Phospholipase D [Psidium guajava]|nr:Phospholipase D [Psidium guajava]
MGCFSRYDSREDVKLNAENESYARSDCRFRSMPELRDDDKPLRKIALSFKELAMAVDSQTVNAEVAPFPHARSLVSPHLF